MATNTQTDKKFSNCPNKKWKRQIIVWKGGAVGIWQVHPDTTSRTWRVGGMYRAHHMERAPKLHGWTELLLTPLLILNVLHQCVYKYVVESVWNEYLCTLNPKIWDCFSINDEKWVNVREWRNRPDDDGEGIQRLTHIQHQKYNKQILGIPSFANPICKLISFPRHLRKERSLHTNNLNFHSIIHRLPWCLCFTVSFVKAENCTKWGRGVVYADSKNSMFIIQQAVRVWAIQISPLMGPFEPAIPPKGDDHQVTWILFGPLNQLAAQEGPTIKTVWTSSASSANCQQHVI